MFILLVQQRNKGNGNRFKVFRIFFNKHKRALFICVCFSDRARKRYEGDDSNCTIHFEQPYVIEENLVCRKLGICFGGKICCIEGKSPDINQIA